MNSFYYLDERKAEGGPAFKISGPAHAEIIKELLEKPSLDDWEILFVNGQGRKYFEK